jgi:CBS domain-containing protein
MKISDVMTRDVMTVSPDVTLKEVAEVLSGLGVSGLPVVEDGRVVGVVSEADVLAKERGDSPRRSSLFGLLLDDGADLTAKLEARTAGEAMTSPAVTISQDRPLAEAAARMLDEQVNRLPVIEEDGTLVGIVTRADLVRAFARSDEEIAREVHEDVVLRTLWIAPERIQVSVEDGEVQITGHVESKAEAELLPEFVRKVAGVVSVSSSLTWDDEGQ